MDREQKVEQTELKTYVILANFISATISPIDPAVHLKAMQTVKAETPKDAFRMFLEKFAKEKEEAERFHNEIYVIEVGEATCFTMKEVFGELYKFPNYSILDDDTNLKY